MEDVRVESPIQGDKPGNSSPDLIEEPSEETDKINKFEQDENGKDTAANFGEFVLSSSTAVNSVWDDLLSDVQNEPSSTDGPAAEGEAPTWGFEFDNDFDASAAVWPTIEGSDGLVENPETNGLDAVFGEQDEVLPQTGGSGWPGFDVRNSPDGKEADLGKAADDEGSKKKDGTDDWFAEELTEGTGDQSEIDGGYDPFQIGPPVPTTTTNVGDIFSSLHDDSISPAAAAVGINHAESPVDDFDPRADTDDAPAQPQSSPGKGGVARSRPRPKTASKPTNPFNIALREAPAWDNKDEDEDPYADPFNFDANLRLEPSEKNNPFAASEENLAKTIIPVEAAVESEWNAFPDQQNESGFNPFATITDEETGSGGGTGEDGGGGFDPFQTIHDDDAFVLPTARVTKANLDDATVSPSRFNPFDKEPPLPEQFASLTPVVKSEDVAQSPKAESSENSIDEPELESQEPLEPFYPKWDPEGGWNLLLRQPFKKKLTQNRFWKPAFVRLQVINDSPVVRVYASDKDNECLHELALQPTFTMCEMGLQQLDQFGKCHTVKIQQVSYRESVGVKSERIAPTISDLTRVRDFKSLKDLVHKPKATMILDHAPHATEILKFGGLNYKEFKDFIHAVEDILFGLKSIRGKSATYTKDEITVDVQDEYYSEIDKNGHITSHKARVRLFCLAFLSESPIVEVGINDKKRRGKEVVGRRDIIPIKTEEWIRTEDPELHSTVEVAEFEKTKVIRFNPLDACHLELMRFRVRPRPNLELPLQVRVQMSIVERHIEVRTEVMVTGYYSSSRRAAQTPCEEIQIRFPIPESWIYLFRVEKRFKYGAIHSSTRKPGKIKGLERLTMFAQGILPASLIEVSTGLAKYENAFQAVVWRIDQLPERNEGAYKTHLMVINLDLAPHDKMPDDLDKYIHVEYSMSNSTVSRAQVRSIAISGVDEPPDRWVRHLAKYEYTIEIEFTDKMKAESEDALAPLTSPTAAAPVEGDGVAPTAIAEDDSDGSSSDSD